MPKMETGIGERGGGREGSLDPVSNKYEMCFSFKFIGN